MSNDLPRSSPRDQDTDPAAVITFLDAIEADPEIELHGLMVLRHGHVVAEGSWAPHTPERTRQLYSISKSFTSAALGFALEEGLLGLDDTAVSHFLEFADEITDARSRSITVRHLASMGSGHDREMWDEATRRDPKHPVRGFLSVPPDAEPGTLFAYSQPCTYTLASIIQRAAGMTLSQYLRPRLFDPLGIDEVGWQAWPPGGPELGFSGLFARIEDIAKLGLLFLQRGRWGETQLIPATYVEQATSRQIDNSNQESEDWRQGYGFGFWVSRHGYRGDGAFGQFCVVLPEHDVVVATTAGTESMQPVLNNLWQHLLPGFDSTTADDRMQQELERRLQALKLPLVLAQPTSRDEADWMDRRFPTQPASDDSATALNSVALRRTGQQLELTITEADNALTIAVGTSDWLTTTPRDAHGNPVPVAASGGWLDEHTVRIEVIFLETPHRMDITCSLPAGSARATWRDVPLGGGHLETLDILGRPS